MLLKWFSAHSAQNVHSNVQIRASSASGGRSLSQHSQFGFRMSIYCPFISFPPLLPAILFGTNDNMTSDSAKVVMFVVFPDVKLLDLAGPMQVFADANLECPGRYDLRIVSCDGEEVASDAILPISTDPISTARDIEIDTLIVAGGKGAFKASDNTALVNAVGSVAARCRRIGSVCTGAFILARAGLLSGRPAVTHWDACERLRQAFSDIDVNMDAIYIKSDNVWTSAGVTAGIDMCLAMVAEDLGRKFALSLARSLVCYMVRPGGQAQFSTNLQQQLDSASDCFDTLNSWILDNLTRNLSVEVLANQANMSPRNFARLYKKHTGATPAKAVETIRTEAACRLLEETDSSVGSIARQCGFSDIEGLRRALARSYNVAPLEYRRRFNWKQD